MFESPVPEVSVQLLGTFSLTIDGKSVSRWRAGKARNLFQYLLIRRGRVVLRDKLYEVLWPEADGAPHSSSLKVAVHALRQILDAPAGSTGPGGVRIVREDFGYVLHADCIQVDLELFESKVEAGRAADRDGDVDGAVAHYTEAMALYAGDLLAGESAEWIVEQREWCRTLALRTLNRLASTAAARDDVGEVLTWCRRILELDPYQEKAYRLLMAAHGRAGEFGAVRRWHDLCVRRLRDELDVLPSSETGHVYLRAMAGDLRRPAALRRTSYRPAAHRPAARTVPALSETG